MLRWHQNAKGIFVFENFQIENLCFRHQFVNRLCLLQCGPPFIIVFCSISIKWSRLRSASVNAIIEWIGQEKKIRQWTASGASRDLLFCNRRIEALCCAASQWIRRKWHTRSQQYDKERPFRESSGQRESSFDSEKTKKNKRQWYGVMCWELRSTQQYQRLISILFCVRPYSCATPMPAFHCFFCLLLLQYVGHVV